MILILGSPAHLGLGLIYEVIQARGVVRTSFVAMEAFPSRLGLYLGGTPEESQLQFPEGDTIRLADVRAVCMDGFFVTAEALTGLDLADIPYVQTETWAALIAMFELLGRRGRLANHVNDRDALATRWSILRYLALQGLPVPRALVTSDREALQRFTAAVGSLGYKAVGDAVEYLQELDPDDHDRLERLALCPVYFEEAPQGRSANLAVVGEKLFCYSPEGEPPPEELQRRCQQAAAKLGLVFAELPLRYRRDEWIVTGLRTFLSPGSLAEEPIMEAAVSWLEAP